MTVGEVRDNNDDSYKEVSVRKLGVVFLDTVLWLGIIRHLIFSIVINGNMGTTSILYTNVYYNILYNTSVYCTNVYYVMIHCAPPYHLLLYTSIVYFCIVNYGTNHPS